MRNTDPKEGETENPENVEIETPTINPAGEANPATDEEEEKEEGEKKSPLKLLPKGAQFHNGIDVEKMTWDQLTEACKFHKVAMIGFKRNEINGKLKTAIHNAGGNTTSESELKSDNKPKTITKKTEPMATKKAKSKKKATSKKPAKKKANAKKTTAPKVVKPKAEKKESKKGEPIVLTEKEKGIVKMDTFSHYKCFLLHKEGRKPSEIAVILDTNVPRASQNIKGYVTDPKREEKMKALVKNA